MVIPGSVVVESGPNNVNKGLKGMNTGTGVRSQVRVSSSARGTVRVEFWRSPKDRVFFDSSTAPEFLRPGWEGDGETLARLE